MTLCRFLQPVPYAPDGVNVLTPEVGATTDLPLALAVAFEARGVVEYVGEAPAPIAAPDAPELPQAALDLPLSCEDCSGDCTVETGCHSAVAQEAGEQAQETALPTMKDSRKAIDAYAAGLGLDTTGLPTKQSALDALEE